MNDHRTLSPTPAPEGERRTTNGNRTSGPNHSGGARDARWQRMALDAKSDMEAYRRVLAAAVANEKNAIAQVDQTKEEALSIRSALSEASRWRGIAEGRVEELERERSTLEARTELLEHELFELREHSARDLSRNRDELESARTRLAFLDAQLESVRGEEHGSAFQALRLRTRVIAGAAIATYLLSLGFFVQLVLALLQTETPPFKLLGVTFALFVAAALLHGRAAHELADDPAAS